MGFTQKQVRALQRTVAPRDVRMRVANGKELSYVEGWYVIAAANRIFGFDGWDRETLETKCVFSRELRGSYLAFYTGRVRVTVRADDRVIVRDGHGTGEGHGNSAGEAHDLAVKTAETDATKWALATFGNAFGLSLYANGRGRREATAVKPQPSVKDLGADPSHHPAMQVETDPAGVGVSAEEVDDIGATVERSATTNRAAPGNGKLAGKAASNGPGFEIASRTSIDKSLLALGEPRRVRDKEHLRYVASQPCLLCSARPADAHHVRFAQPRALGMKVGDHFTVPLCRKHHRDLHHSGDEASWWHDMGIDAVEIATELWRETSKSR